MFPTTRAQKVSHACPKIEGTPGTDPLSTTAALALKLGATGVISRLVAGGFTACLRVSRSKLDD